LPRPGGSGRSYEAEKILASLQEGLSGDNDLAHGFEKYFGRGKTMDKGGYDALADGKGSIAIFLKDKEEAVSLEQENRQVKTEDTVQRLIDEKELRAKASRECEAAEGPCGVIHTEKRIRSRAQLFYEQLQNTEIGGDASLDKAIADTTIRISNTRHRNSDANAPDYTEKPPENSS